MGKQITNEEFQKALDNQDNKNIIKHVTNSYAKILDSESLQTCGLHALWHALQGHNPDHPKKQKFTTSLWRYCHWECRKQLRIKNKKLKKECVSIEDINKNLMSKSKSPTVQDLEDCINSLDIKSKDYINNYYFNNMTMEEIGNLEGSSKETARNNIRKSLSELKRMMTNQ